MAFLMVSITKGETFRYDLAGTSVRIGRSEENDLVLRDRSVSRGQHARIERRPGGDYILHVEGRNRTAVNDREITAPTLLHAGDSIRIGGAELTYNDISVEISIERSPVIVQATLASDPGATGTDAAPSAERATQLNLIQQASRELVLHRPLSEIFESIFDLASRIVPFERAVLMTLEGRELIPQMARVPRAEERISLSRTIARQVLYNGESVLAEDALADERFRDHGSVADQKIRSLMCVPLMTDREMMGLLYLDSRREKNLFTEENLRLMTHLANVAAIKIENKRLFDQVVDARIVAEELRKAGEIQHHLLPAAAPPVAGYQLHGSSTPCQEVGGDYYDFLELSTGRVGLALGDVSGKGLSAALLMGYLHSSVQVLAEQDLDPCESITRLNRLLLRRLPPNRLVTLFYAVLDPATHLLCYVNAGQNRPCLIRADGAVDYLAKGGLPLSVLEDARYNTKAVQFEAGDVLLCYSDGLTEGQDPAGEAFGERRLLGITREVRSETPATIVGAIQEAFDDHCADRPREDDVTLVVVKRDR